MSDNEFEQKFKEMQEAFEKYERAKKLARERFKRWYENPYNRKRKRSDDIKRYYKKKAVMELRNNFDEEFDKL